MHIGSEVYTGGGAMLTLLPGTAPVILLQQVAAPAQNGLQRSQPPVVVLLGGQQLPVGGATGSQEEPGGTAENDASASRWCEEEADGKRVGGVDRDSGALHHHSKPHICIGTPRFEGPLLATTSHHTKY